MKRARHRKEIQRTAAGKLDVLETYKSGYFCDPRDCVTSLFTKTRTCETQLSHVLVIAQIHNQCTWCSFASTLCSRYKQWFSHAVYSVDELFCFGAKVGIMDAQLLVFTPYMPFIFYVDYWLLFICKLDGNDSTETANSLTVQYTSSLGIEPVTFMLQAQLINEASGTLLSISSF